MSSLIAMVTLVHLMMDRSNLSDLVPSFVIFFGFEAPCEWYN
ncbi:hypothetical protein Hdeb2414_s0277g00855331 [Helianthus debilis subsp. tardiflorus]